MTDNKLIDKIDNDNIPTFSVSEITKEITDLLEDKYSYVKIKGEISGETGNKYPEIYFTLKDEENVISAIIKRNKIPNLKFLPEDGLEVVCIGKIIDYHGLYTCTFDNNTYSACYYNKYIVIKH